jgi:putative hydrolase of the HAD superfamily
MHEAILFDFDGTLVDFVASDIESLRYLHVHSQAQVRFDDFLRTAVEEIMQFHNYAEEGVIDPLQLHRFRLKNTFRRHGLGWREEYVKFYRSKLVEACRPYEGVKQLLSAIGPEIKTGLISNAYDAEEQRARLKHSGLEDLFDTVVIAGEVGVYKPDPAIFNIAMNGLGVVPDKTLYVGDSIRYDIIGAKTAGMQTVLIGQISTPGAEQADHIVDNGAEGLGPLLGRLCGGQTACKP